MPSLRVAYVGNFRPEHSTENHVARALEACGHAVARLQEDAPATWRALAEDHWAGWCRTDLLLWTRTGWDWASVGLDRERAANLQRWSLDAARVNGIPTVGYHLDRWWGLDREGQVGTEPFFHVDLLCTADGGHDAEWVAAGVNHRWFPPGVSEGEARPGQFHERLAADVAFVGSWKLAYDLERRTWDGYHDEWAPTRLAMLEDLRATYGPRFRLWPQGGAIRGQRLRDVYASTKVLVGDSCLSGGIARYWSDRIPETLGRGGFLVHPYVGGIEEHYTDGKHLRLFPMGDWAKMRALVDYYVDHDDERQAIAAEGRRHVLATATYEVRMRQLERLLRDEGLL